MIFKQKLFNTYIIKSELFNVDLRIWVLTLEWFKRKWILDLLLSK